MLVQVSPPDVTGAQLVGSRVNSPNTSPRPGGSIGDSLLGNNTLFPTVEDMPPSPSGSDDYYGSLFQSRPRKSQHTDATPLLGTGESQSGQRASGARSRSSRDSHSHVQMKPVESGVLSLHFHV